MDQKVIIAEENNNSASNEKVSAKKIIMILLALVVATGLMASCGSDSDKDDKAVSSGGTTYDVSLIDDATGMRMEPATLTVKSGENVVLNVTNDGTVPHNVTMDDGMATADLAVYSSATLDIGKITEDTTVHCSIAGHKEQGMVMDIKVEK